MYRAHQLLQEPTPDTKLWRYMDLAKFLAILESRSLHFAALGTFDDPFEGHPPRSAVELMTAEPPDLTPEVLREKRALIENNLRVFQMSRKCIFASCWHMNDTESAGMWSQYIRAGEGLAIQTTFRRIRDCFVQEGPEVSGGVVQYINFETHVDSEFNIMLWGILKRMSYSHENEFRLLNLNAGGTTGLNAPVDVNDLIERVYVAPTTPDWLFGLVRSLLDRYSLPAEIVRSELAQGPKYMTVPHWARDA